MTNRARVLIIDDRVGVRQTLRNVLFGLDCDFTEAVSGESAIAILSSQKFDVTFLDLSLSNISGLEVLEQGREKGDAMGMVIVLTGLPEDSTRTKAMALGAFAYLSKDPIDRTTIRQTFTNAVRASRPSTTPSPAPPAPSEEAPLKPKARRVSRRQSTMTPNRRKLLVLDDKEYWLETIERLLQDEFEIVGATTPNEAYAKMKRDDFALVVLDMKLPGDENGLDVLSRMRRARQDLRAIILTEYPDWKEAVESGRRGAIDYVSKGDPTTLKSVVTRILAERPATRVFLSYDRRDKARVLQLYNRLMTRGFIPWIDVKSLIPGQRYALQIEDAVKGCDHFVFCVSHHSVEQKDSLLQQELRIALDLERQKWRGSSFLIPVRLEPCEDHPDLGEFQAVDLYHREGFARLMKALSSNHSKDR
jgi:DNA-binding NtrC family response regulator